MKIDGAVVLYNPNKNVIDNIKSYLKPLNKLYVIDIEKPDEEVMKYKTGGGFFFQYECDSLNYIIPFLGKECQTVAVLGIDKDETVKMVRDKGVRGVDRVVDLGDTMGLEFTWDGYKMIEAMSRVIYVYER